MQDKLLNFFTNNRYKSPNWWYNPDPNADWIMNCGRIPYLSLQLMAHIPYTEMLAEARTLDHRYVEHRDADSSGWSSLCIHGISSQHTDHYQVYPEYRHLTNEEVPYAWTDISDACPVTCDFFQNIFPYDVYHRVRFMRLAPGGYILPHSDSPDLGLRAINMSLNNPAGCDFVFEGNGIVPFSDSGSVIMIANGFRHAVHNQSDDYRYHIIVHGYATTKYDEFASLLTKSYQALMPEVIDV
jgi:Aspartyl/Asparaginyl beta-hydroxylase